MQFADMAARSVMVPKDFQGKPENIMLAVQMGSEIGLAPMQALQNIAVINGRPAVWGDAMLGLCKASEFCEDVIETIAGEGDKMVATCIAKRYGKEPVVRTFSHDDAKQAGLIGKSGPWSQYKSRMLQMRARGFALRDAFPDVLRGLIAAEEAQDIPPETRTTESFTGPTLDAKAEPPVTAPPKMTKAVWLDNLEAELSKATSREDVFAIVSREDVQKAFAAFTNGAAERLQAITDAADKRFPVAAAPLRETAVESDEIPF